VLAKVQYDQPIGSQHVLHLGAERSRNVLGLAYDQILFVCNEFDPTCADTRRGRVADTQRIRSKSGAISAADTWHITDRVDLDLGVQYQGNTYTRESFVNPRGALAWQIAERWTFSLKAGRYNRFPDLGTVLPTIGNTELRSPRATHWATGLKQELGHGWSWNTEVYYKELTDLPLALDAGQPDAARLYSNDVRGRAYGVDLLINKQRTEKWYGWLALSMAKSERTNERTGVTRDYRLDTPFLLNGVMSYEFTPRFDAGLRFTVRSGQVDTPIIGIQDNPDFPGYVQAMYGEPFSDRLPLYSRVDLRFRWQLLVKGYDSAVTLDVINAFNMHNVEGRSFDYKRSRAEGKAYVQDSEGAGLFPALTFRITF